MSSTIVRNIVLALLLTSGIAMAADADLIDCKTPAGDHIQALVADCQKLGGQSIAASIAAFRDCPDCPEMVTVPAGSFDMGSPSYEGGRFDHDGPVHRVNIPAFALGKTEITKGQFAAFVKKTSYSTGDKCWTSESNKKESSGRNWRNPGFQQDDSHPVLCVNWEDAKAYVAWLSKKTGKQYRLPSEAEWEYAARAGTTTPRYWDESQSKDCGYANLMDSTGKAQIQDITGEAHNCTDGYTYTAPVGSFKPNRFGLNDMIGNVWEWVDDSWHNNYIGAPTDGSAWQGDDAKRVNRGGSWTIASQNARSADRSANNSGFRGVGVGFRVARTLP